MNSGIYKIENILNNKVYVGSAINFKARWKAHRRLLDRKTHPNRHLQFAWIKEKPESFSFTIIERCDKPFLLEREQFYIDFYDSANPELGYNIFPLAGTSLGHVVSDETKKKISEIKKGHLTAESTRLLMSANSKKRNKDDKTFGFKKGHIPSDDVKRKIGLSNKGKKLGRPTSDEAKKKISEAKKGFRHSEETKQKMSLAKRQMSDETKQKMSIAKRNISEDTRKKLSLAKQNMSAETRRKMSIARKGHPVSLETREKISRARKNYFALKKLVNSQ